MKPKDTESMTERDVDALVDTLIDPMDHGDMGAAVSDALRLPDEAFNLLLTKMNRRLEDA